MEAGIELDKLVAEKVMGWKDVWQPFQPSTDIADAWQVVNKFIFPESLFALFKSHRVYNHETLNWETPGYEAHIGCACEDYDNCPESVWAETAPLAICLAALKAVGVDVNA